jgi:hypothetical protein
VLLEVEVGLPFLEVEVEAGVQTCQEAVGEADYGQKLGV